MLVVASVLLAGCGRTETSVHVSVQPASVEVVALTEQRFVATIDGSLDEAVTWSLAAGPGALSPDGVYTAPELPRDVDNYVVVRATSRAEATQSADAVIRVVPAPIEPARGRSTGGTRVTLTGANVVQATAITFAGIPGRNLESAGPTAIRVTTPPGLAASSADVEVVLPAGSIRYPRAFRYGAAELSFGGQQTFTVCVPQFGSGLASPVPLQFDEDAALEYSLTCDGKLTVFDLTSGSFSLAAAFPAPFGTTLNVRGGPVDPVVYSFATLAGPSAAFRSSQLMGATLLDEVVIAGAVQGPSMADLDGDGWAEGVALRPANDDVVVVWGSAGGLLEGTPFFVPVGADVGFSSSAAAVDLDGAGGLDLVVSHGGAMPGFRVFLSDGARGFAPPVPYSMTGSVLAATVGDFGGSGAFDVVAGAQWRIGNGDGTFGAALSPALPASRVALGDLDGDGYDDVADGKTIWYGSAVGLQANTTTACTNCFNVAGVYDDERGERDLFLRFDGQLATAPASGPRSYSHPFVALSEPFPLLAPSGEALFTVVPAASATTGALIALVDPLIPEVISEGRLPPGSDAMAIRAAPSGAVVADPGTFAADGALWVVSDLASASDAVRIGFGAPIIDGLLGDLDGDTFPDAVAATDDGLAPAVWVAWGAPGGIFESPVSIPLDGSTSPRWLDLARGEEDSADVLAVRDSEENAWVVRFDAARSLRVEVVGGIEPCGANVLGAPHECGVRLDDFDLDGVLDLVTTSTLNLPLAFQIRIVFVGGEPGGTFRDPQTILAGPIHFSGRILGIHSGDFDGDQVPDAAVDIASPSFNYTGMCLFRGDSGGFLYAGEFLAGVQGPTFVGDWDADGRTDLAAILDPTGSIRLLHNTAR